MMSDELGSPAEINPQWTDLSDIEKDLTLQLMINLEQAATYWGDPSNFLEAPNPHFTYLRDNVFHLVEVGQPDLDDETTFDNTVIVKITKIKLNNSWLSMLRAYKDETSLARWCEMMHVRLPKTSLKKFFFSTNVSSRTMTIPLRPRQMDGYKKNVYKAIRAGVSFVREQQNADRVDHLWSGISHISPGTDLYERVR